MFRGEFNHTIDAKGRIIIPVKFREKLGEDFIVTQGLDGCLSAYPVEEWKHFEENLTALSLIKKENRQLIRFFVSRAAEVELDKQGRILIPGPLREYACLEKDVVLVGVLNRVEIWDKQRYLDSEVEDMDEVAERMADCGLTI